MADQLPDITPSTVGIELPKVSSEPDYSAKPQTFDEFKNNIINLGSSEIKVPPISGIGGNPGSDNKPKLTALQQALLNSQGPDSSKYAYDVSDLSDRYKTILPDVNNEYLHHEGQSSMDRIGNTAVNLVAKTAGYLTQTAGFIAGAPVAVASWDISNLTDNFLVKAGTALTKGVEDTNPIYKGKQYTEGNIWQKLSTTDWWLSDAVDRAALTIATIVPGFAETRGVGLFGTLATDVAETGSAIKATGVGAKLIESAMANPQEFGTMGKLFARGVYDAAALGGVSGNAATTTMLRSLNAAELFGMGVVGQSGLNAKEALESVKQSLEDQRTQGLNSFTDQQINERASQAAVKGFWYTAPLSFINEIIELPMLFSSVRNVKNSLLNKVFNPETGEVLANALQKQAPKWYNVAFKVAATGFEHGQNESMQVAIGRTLDQEYGSKKDARGRILPGSGLGDTGEGSSILQNFIDNVNDPNGQNNIALGTIQGMLTALVGFGKDIKTGRYTQELAQRQSVHDQIVQAKLNRRYYETDFAQRDSNGKMVTDTKGNVQFDQQKLSDAGLSLAGITKNIQDMYDAMQVEDHTKVKQLQDESLAGFAYNFLNDSNGINHLNNLLKIKSDQLSTDANRVNDISVLGNEITPTTLHAKQLEKIQEFKKIYNNVDSDRITTADLGEYEKQYDVYKRQYLEALKFTKYVNSAKQLFLSDKINENISDALSLGVNQKIDSPSNSQERKGNALLYENIKLEKELAYRKEDYKNLISPDENKKSFEEYLKNSIGYMAGPKYDTEEEVVAKQEAEAEQQVESDYNFVNKDGEKQNIETGREYQIPESKKATISKLDDDKYQVTAPNGDITLHETKKEADDAAEDLNKSFNDLAKIKVLDTNADGTIKIKDINGDIQNISTDQLAGYEKIQSDQEKLQKFADDINKEQAEIEFNSGDIATVDSSIIIPVYTEGKLKDASIMFESTTSETEGDNFIPKPHQARAIEFLNNVSRFPNRAKLKTILVTPNQENSLGLEGLTEAQFSKPKAEVENLTNIDLGFVAAVYVEQDGNDIYFVDKEGNRVAKVGEKMDMSKVVFNTMPTTELRYKDKNLKYRPEQKELAEAKASGWKQMRAKLFEASGYKVYNFTVSNGIPNTIQGERNSIGETLVPKSIISTQEKLIQISSNGFIFHKGKQVKVSVGHPYVQFGDMLQGVRGRTFTAKESQGVVDVLKKISKDINTQLAAGKSIKINRVFSTYLQNVLYWKSKGASGDNQIFINTNTMNLELGKEKYDLTNIADNEKKITEQLKSVYQNINRDTLTNKFHDKFLEPHIGPDGNLTISEWDNYQTYLLADTYPNGSSRSISETPLSTNVAKITDAVPYNFKQKYSILEGMELPEQVVTPKVVAKAAPIQETTHDYTLDGTTENVFDLSSGPIIFIATQDGNGNTFVKINDNATIDNIAKDENKVKQIIDSLKANNSFDASKSDVEIVKDFLKLRIAADIQKEVQTIPNVPAPIVEEVKPESKVEHWFSQAVGNDINKSLLSDNSKDKVWGIQNNNGEYEVSKITSSIPHEQIEKRQESVIKPLFDQDNIYNEGDKINIIKPAKLQKNADGSFSIREKGLIRYGEKELPKEEVKPVISDIEKKKEALIKERDEEIRKVHFPKTFGPVGFAYGTTFYTLEDLAKGVHGEESAESYKKLEDTLRDESKSLDDRVVNFDQVKSKLGMIWGTLEMQDKDIAAEFHRIYNAWGKENYGSKWGDMSGTEFGLSMSKFILKYWSYETLAGKETRPLYEFLKDPRKGIIDEYNEKLAELEGSKTELEGDKVDFSNSKPPKEYRKVGNEEVGGMTDAEIELFKEWHNKNVPNISFEILDRIITTNDNKTAWGVFENGVAKFVKGGLKGTEYHEVGEAVWNGFLSSEEQQALLDEFKSKTGKFKDRESGKMLFYEEATDNQAKERILDDFSDFRLGKLPARNIGERILKFFRNILSFVKSFVNKPSLKEELFKAIDTGKFKEFTISEVSKTLVPQYRAVEGLSEQMTNLIIKDMTARISSKIFGTNESLYNISNLSSPEIFNSIKDEYTEEGKIIPEQIWNELVVKTKDFIRTYKIEFDKDNTLDINAENTTSTGYAVEAFTTEWKKNSLFPVKILVGTLIDTVPTNQQDSSTLSLPAAFTEKGFLKLVSFSKAFGTVIDKLANTTKVSNMIAKLINLAKYDSNYVRLFTRLKGNMGEGGTKGMFIDFSKFQKHDWRLFTQVYQTFTKQKPEALVQYVNNGNVYTAPANLFTVVAQTKTDWINNLKDLSTDPNSFVRYNKTQRTYKVISTEGVDINTPQKMVDFLNKIGITYTLDTYLKLKSDQRNDFAEAVGSIHTYFGKTKEIASVTGKTLGINGPLDTLSNLFVSVENPIQDSTFYNVQGDKRQSYSENNAPSLFTNEFNEADTLDELKISRPELNDVFSINSIFLKKGGLFFNNVGKKIKSLKISYIDGTKNEDNNVDTSTSALTLGNRFTQEINQNLNGNYNILNPADSSTEWMMNLGNNIRFDEIASGLGWDKVNIIFKGYLKDDIALAQSNRSYLNNTKPRAKELRFFKDILTGKTLSGINNLIINNATEEQIDEYINNNIDDINKDVKLFIEDNVKATKKILIDNNKIINNPNGTFKYESLDDKFITAERLNKKALLEDDINDILTFARTNYIINNIELHKILFGDPYQFAIKKGNLDETKRIKSFLSPRRTTFDSPEFNSFHNVDYNKVNGINLVPGDIGYYTFKPFINTVTLKDIIVNDDTNEADAASFIMDNTYREVKLRNGQWSDEAEAWHQWQMAYTRQTLATKGDYTYTNKNLQKIDINVLKDTEPEYVTDVIKPIVSGNKYSKNQFDLVLDKFSQMPLYYKAIENTNLGKLYEKMWKEDVGYAVFESGRKVGAETLHDLYNEDGSFNETPFENKIPVAWKSYGIQVENSYEKAKSQTRGSQLTKISSIDIFDNGIASSEDAANQYKRNIDTLDALHEEAYTQLLNKLGIEDLGDGYNVVDPVTVSKTLEYEMLKRELSDNIKDTVQLDENKEFRVPFESSPAYTQIRNILYSMVDKALISPKMNGSSKVQVPVTLWEKSGENRKVIEINGKKVFTDGSLKFYTKDKPYMEILIPHWFKEQFKKAGFKADEELLEYLNKPENESILKGIGFRIPTQSLSSVEVFKIKGFLPQSMGDTVVVPSEITKKAGSDFDIDKLNMYLKNIYIDSKGKLKQVPFFGYGEKAKEAIKKFILKEDLESIFDINERTVESTEDDYGKLADKLYKQSLENEYFDSLEKLITLPENYDRLTNPLSDAGLEKISEELDKLKGSDETKIKNRILDGNYMTSLRHAFITAKKWVGIGAVNITNHSLFQKAQVYLDPLKIAGLSSYEKRIIGNGQILLPHNKVMIDGKERVSLSGVLDKANKYISDNLSGFITSFVDVAKNPYILKIIASNNSISTAMFLTRIGTPVKTTALFLNQPIVKEYLNYLDSIDSKSVYSKKNLDIIRTKFPVDRSKVVNAKIEMKNLSSNIQNYYSGKTIDNAEQQKILAEFLKYHKMSQYLFKMSQSTNYDTTKFRSAESMSKKMLRTEIAEQSNIFTSAKDILNKSFIGKQAKLIQSSMNALGAILKLDQLEYSVITAKVLEPYSANEYLSIDNFDKIADKIKSSFIDYIFQTKTDLTDRLEELLINPYTAVVTELAKARKDYPNMEILQQLTQSNSDRVGGAKSIKLKANLKDAYDENLYTGMMRELRDNPTTNALYNRIIDIAILQGTYQSAISIKNIIPIEDYSERVKNAINSVSSDLNLDNFSKSGAFQRNNWNDENIFKKINNIIPSFYNEGFNQQGEFITDIAFDEFPTLDGLSETGAKNILMLDRFNNFTDVASDYVLIPRVIINDKQRIDIITNKPVTSVDYAKRKAIGDTSLNDVMGFQKVKYSNGEDLTIGTKYIYKAINLWGDGNRATEMYNDTRKSVFSNGTIKIDKELPNANILKYFEKDVEEEVVPSQDKENEIKPEGLPAIEDKNQDNC